MAPLDALTISVLRWPRALLFAGALLCAACPPDSSSEDRDPAGTTADPVEVCERAGDVCELDGSRLGVCVQSDSCPGDTCYVCQPQH